MLYNKLVENGTKEQLIIENERVGQMKQENRGIKAEIYDKVTLEEVLKKVLDRQAVKSIMQEIVEDTIERNDLLTYYGLTLKDAAIYDIEMNTRFMEFKEFVKRTSRVNKATNLKEYYYKIDRIGLILKYLCDKYRKTKHKDLDYILLNEERLMKVIKDTTRFEKTRGLEGIALNGLEGQLTYLTMILHAIDIMDNKGYKGTLDWLIECLMPTEALINKRDLDKEMVEYCVGKRAEEIIQIIGY